MIRFFKGTLLLLVFATLLTNCRKKAYDEYYGRPDTLESPIYQQLQGKGNFKSLLAAIDKAGYKNTLSAAGYWTLFAPHDSAFQVYFTEKGINGIGQLDSAACQQIVTYCLVYNAFKKERIADYQSSSTIGWVPNIAFKRRTASYRGVYDGKDTAGKAMKMIASNRNNNLVNNTFYAEADNNNKYIPYFTDNFLAAKNLSAADYAYFYPNTTYTGFNVVDAKVTEKDITAENGVIHVVNRVITALPSIDEYIAGKPEYSLFKGLFDKYLVEYILNSGVTQKNQAITGNPASVFTKVYNSALGFSLNNENFLKQQDNDGQQNTYTIFVPTNTVLQSYINTVLLENYSKLEDLPRSIIYDFINAHLWQTAVWPSKFANTFNVLNEEARFDPASNVVDKKVLSNGIFYGTNKVQESNLFSSVYGKAYLDPKYSMMASLLNIELKYTISNIHQKYTMFMISNQVFNAEGYFADPTVSNDINNQWRFTPPAGSAATASTGSTTLVRLQRILNMHVVPEIDMTATQLASEGAALSFSGEYIGYKNNKVFGSGNIDVASSASVVSSVATKNGTVHYISRMLMFSDTSIGNHVKRLGTATTSPYNSFWRFLSNSPIFTAATGDIVGVSAGTFYTLFIPTNAAILQAVNDGLLPGTGTAPNKIANFAPTTSADQDKVAKFIYYHILNKKVVAQDGVESGTFETLLKKNNGDPTTIFVNNSMSPLQLTDMNSLIAKVISAKSEYLSNRCVIHLTDKYLKYID
ncbi:MAG: fasciclin domain-containing protein [Chitinophagaceae bacterium]